MRADGEVASVDAGPEGLCLRGDMHRAAAAPGFADRALECYTKALQQQPRNVRALRGRAHILILAGQDAGSTERYAVRRLCFTRIVYSCPYLAHAVLVLNAEHVIIHADRALSWDRGVLQGLVFSAEGTLRLCYASYLLQRRS